MQPKQISNNMIKYLSISFILLFLTFTLVVVGQKGITYDFDEVEVPYAAEFTAKPINASSDNWLVQLAGGTDKPVKVLYGVVNLKKEGQTILTEEFIKVSGQSESKRFLYNSVANGYYDYETGSRYKSIATFFWSAKQLVDTSVVKDFTPPIISITLYRNFDENQNLNKFIITASNDGEQAAEQFWTLVPSGSIYEVDLGTLVQTGDQTTKAS